MTTPAPLDAQAAVSALTDLETRVRACSTDFYHSRPLVQYRKEYKDSSDSILGEDRAALDLRDLLVASAITANNVLLIGKSGAGKTHLSKMVMTALFGTEGYKTLPIDATFGIDKLRDMAFGDISAGKNLKEAVRATGFLTCPGIIVDEYNRAPSEITNMLQGYLQNGALVFEGGREVTPGIQINGSDERYQWKVATANEGKAYLGARKFDKASRDRLAIEIPLDIFPPADADRRALAAKTSSGLAVEASAGDVSDVLELLEHVRAVPLSTTLREFIIYLGRMDQCVKAANYTKLDIENFTPEFCQGCHHAAESSNICGSVFAPSERSLINLQNMSRAFALLRYARSGYQHKILKAEIDDFMAAAPFALYSKIDIHPGWIDTTSQASRWSAVSSVVKIAYTKFKSWFHANRDTLRKLADLEARGGMGAAEAYEARRALHKYASDKDVWSADLRMGP